jgi:hypothetical protein
VESGQAGLGGSIGGATTGNVYVGATHGSPRRTPTNMLTTTEMGLLQHH